MGAPKGHTKWGNPIKPKIFETPQELWDTAVAYFKWADEHPWKKQDFIKGGDFAGTIIELENARPYTIEGFCIFANISTQTFRNYRENEKYKTYFEVSRAIEEIIYNNKFEGAAVGAFQHNIIAADLGLEKKKRLTIDQDEPLTIKIAGQKFDV